MNSPSTASLIIFFLRGYVHDSRETVDRSPSPSIDDLSAYKERLSRPVRYEEGFLSGLATASCRERAAPPLPLGDFVTSSRSGKVDVVGEGGVEVEVEGVPVGGETSRADREGALVRLVLGEEAVEGDAAVPLKRLLEHIVVEHARGGVERLKDLVRQMRAVSLVHASKRVRSRHDCNDLLRSEAHAAVLGVWPGLAETTDEGDLVAAAGFNGRDGGDVHGVGHEDRGAGDVAAEGAGEEFVRHVLKREALVADAPELVDDAAVEAEGAVRLEPRGWNVGWGGGGSSQLSETLETTGAALSLYQNTHQLSRVVESEPQPDGRQHAPSRGLPGFCAALLGDEGRDLVRECLVDCVGAAVNSRSCGRHEGGRERHGSAKDRGEHVDERGRRDGEFEVYTSPAFVADWVAYCRSFEAMRAGDMAFVKVSLRGSQGNGPARSSPPIQTLQESILVWSVAIPAANLDHKLSKADSESDERSRRRNGPSHFANIWRLSSHSQIFDTEGASQMPDFASGECVLAPFCQMQASPLPSQPASSCIQTSPACKLKLSISTNMSTVVEKVYKSVVKSVLSVEQDEGVGARVRRSIGNYHLRNLDPFLMLDQFTVTEPAGFPDHPHRGFETVTYMLEGK
ncbi:hypothetical protein BDK51DRAFT_47587 [Blyttiomyces helicus]|uniref:Pirin N-terminal domain-containing protein n=1 Tax=Blyttiomyces helicus TaxID=388810 RepID=A0A4P9W4K8_9FUNG|nr:hypothetical protein BDK51DRAFT_47587 [Blyttiomyces helicus]|eukprot:RKO85798.1 hypothetical protein BDK51DRAFT_47587 [Blyttiomyces helicus]